MCVSIIFVHRMLCRGYAVAAEGIEAGVPPIREHGYHFPGYLPLGEEHLEHFVPEDICQCLQIKRNDGRSLQEKKSQELKWILSRIGIERREDSDRRCLEADRIMGFPE